MNDKASKSKRYFINNFDDHRKNRYLRKIFLYETIECLWRASAASSLVVAQLL